MTTCDTNCDGVRRQTVPHQRMLDEAAHAFVASHPALPRPSRQQSAVRKLRDGCWTIVLRDAHARKLAHYWSSTEYGLALDGSSPAFLYDIAVGQLFDDEPSAMQPSWARSTVTLHRGDTEKKSWTATIRLRNEHRKIAVYACRLDDPWETMVAARI